MIAIICVGIIVSLLILVIVRKRVNIRSMQPKSTGKPIDVVYTFVNDRDSNWRKSKQLCLEKRFDPKIHNHDSIHPNRFRNMDELKYSLRSIDKFAPWIRKVYLVVASREQIPDWLDTSCSRLTIIYHKDILPAKSLPTFNSHSIEANLHRIEDLSDVFLYFNDDVFLGKNVSRDDFLEGKRMRFFPSSKEAPSGKSRITNASHSSAWRNTNSWLNKRFTQEGRHKMEHTISVLKKSIIFDIWSEMKRELDLTTAQPFRSINDYNLTCGLFQYYAFYKGKATPTEDRSEIDYIEITNDHYINQLKFDSVSRGKPFTFCLNDTTEEISPEVREQVKSFLETYFPNKSKFEK